MKRSPKAEAQRKVTLAETMYAKLVEKNRKAEADYREKIERLKAEYYAVDDAE